jgi:hypothetical protein
MPYIGTSPSNGVRRKYTYTATASQTSFSGAGAEGATLSYKDSNFVDVYQNGVKLSEADYTATSGTAIVLAQGASVSDIVEVVVYDVFSVADTVSKADGGTFDGAVTFAGAFTSQGIDDNADAVAMTIDSSENVLVSKTSSGIGTAGIELRSNNDVLITSSGSQALYLNRLSSDGSIAEFRKDGTTVGSIQSRAGAMLSIAFNPSGSDGAGFTGGSNAVLPANASALSDNAIDLGVGSYRYKDLYLSGGVFLGGTGSANQISDYEEGTWTVTDASGAGLTITQTTVAQYIKVGTMVYVNAYITMPSTSDATGILLGGLPFTPLKVSYGSGRVQAVGSSNLVFQFNNGTANLYVMHPHAVVTYATASTSYVLFSGVYQTS